MRLSLAIAIYCVACAATAATAADAGALPTIVPPRVAHASVLDSMVGLSSASYLVSPIAAPQPEALPAAPLTAAAISPGQVVVPLTTQLGLTIGPAGTPPGYSLSSGCLAGSWSSARGNCTNLMPWVPDSTVGGVSGGLLIARPGSAYSLTLSASQLSPVVPERGLPLAGAAAPGGGPIVLAAPNVRGQEYNLAATGVWSFERLGALSVTGSVGEALLRSPLSPQADLDRNQATVALALSRGAFSGGVVGRVVSDTQGGNVASNWTGLDVGMSWRTPWRGELSFGARNLITGGDDTLLPDPGLSQRDDRRERTPYIEYRQDF
jgi:hypothetical protein